VPSQPPKELTEKILAQRGRIEGERRQVTVMFCDLEGSTALTEKLGDEKAFALIDEIFGILTQQVHKYEGTVQEFRGDGIMALFGAPIALENAALAIQQEVTKFSHGIEEEARGPAIRMRIGIHTGPVVLGTIGSDLRLEFQVIGDTVNLAARVESLAEPGTIYVTEETFKHTEAFFRFEKMGEKEVKGKETPVTVYRVIAPSSLRTRFDVSAEQGLTPLVGRRRELEFLLDGLERAKSGQGQAFTIISEAGLGKSRLLYEFRKSVSNEDITFLEGRCISYGRGLAYHPIIAILRSFFNIQEGEEDLRVKGKVKKGLEILGVEVDTTLPFLLEFLSVKDSGLAPFQVSPEAKRDKMIEALKRIILKGAEIRPLIITLEDLHWIDKSSEEALKTILESLPGSRVLAIFTSRPEFVPPWGGKTYHSSLMLQRLSIRESLEMAAQLLGTGDLEKSLEELLLEKTEGIPFFLEEFLKSLQGLKLIENRGEVFGLSRSVLEMTVPTTIQEVILARVDSLPPEAKEVLQTGSVIEREFDFLLIKRVMNLQEHELVSLLNRLKDSELIYERGIAPESTSIFKHALTREVVYESILTERRKKLHEAVGLSLEMLHKERLDDYYGLLSEHFIKSENYGKGAEYSKKAARRAEKAALLDNAIAYAGKRVSCLEKLTQGTDLEKQRIDARTVLGLYLVQMDKHLDAKKAIDPILDLALRHNYKRRLGQIYLILGANYCQVEENQPEAIRVLEKALESAEETQDIITYALGSFWLGFSYGMHLEFNKSFDYLQRVIDVNLAANNQWGVAATKGNLGLICSWLWGKCDLGFQISGEGVKLAEECGDLTLGIAYGAHGFSCLAKGYSDEAEKYLLQSVEYSERSRHQLWNGLAHIGLGDLYWEKKYFIKSKESFKKAYRWLENSRIVPSITNLAKIGFGRSKVFDHEKDVNLETLFTYSRNNRQKLTEGVFQRWISETLNHLSGEYLLEAESRINQAIEADFGNGTMWNLGKDYLSYADLLTKKGDRHRAKENLGKAIETFKECGSDGWVEKAEKKRARVS
jgi:class 3 adenylate cyclase/tetratricopeptide (TPR) repeat protein